MKFEGRSGDSWKPDAAGGTRPGAPHLVEPRRDPGAPPAASLFYRFTRSVSDGGGEPIGDLVIFRDVSREIEVERMKAEVNRLPSELDTTYVYQGS